MDKTQIANIALKLLGSSSVTSLEENSKEASVIKEVFETAKAALLQEHPWNFAIKRVVLSPSTEKVPFGYENAFIKPPDCLRILNVYPIDVVFVAEGNNLLSNENVLNIRYISDVSDTSLFSNQFAELLAVKIAQEVAFNFSSNATLSNSLFEIYNRKLITARSIDAAEGTPNEVSSRGSSWLEARY